MFFLLLGMNATEMAVLSVFWQKNGLGTLGVKVQKNCHLGAKGIIVECQW